MRNLKGCQIQPNEAGDPQGQRGGCTARRGADVEGERTEKKSREIKQNERKRNGKDIKNV